jgi:alpha-tubulin suppressor-like RCC1 family protein
LFLQFKSLFNSCSNSNEESYIFGNGINSHGQLGIWNIESYEEFTQLKFPSKFRFHNAACGSDFSIILTELSLVYGFENNLHSQIEIECDGLDLLFTTQMMSLCGFPVIDSEAHNSHSLVRTITGLVLGTWDHSNDQLRISNSKVSEYTTFGLLQLVVHQVLLMIRSDAHLGRFF